MAALIGLSGCAHGGMDHGRLVLRLSGYAGDPAEMALVSKLVGEFNRANPDLLVHYEPIFNPYEPKILTMMVSHTAPDVFYLQDLYAEAFRSKHVLLPLNAFMARDHVATSSFLPNLLSTFMDGNTVYGLPKDFNSLGLFYDKALFDQAHLAYPNASWTLADLRHAAIALTNSQHAGLAYPIDTIDRFMPFAWAYGAHLMDGEGRYVLDSPQGAAALTFYADLRLRDHAAIYPSEVGAHSTMDAFGEGKAAMVLDGGWLIAHLHENYPDLRYGIAPFPRGPAGHGNFLFTVSYAIPASERHPEAAWRLLRFMTSSEAQSQLTFAIPSRVAESKRFVALHPEYAAILAGARDAHAYAFGPHGGKVKDRLGEAIQEVFLANVSPERALAQAGPDIEALNSL